jgi:hypothetical protein
LKTSGCSRDGVADDGGMADTTLSYAAPTDRRLARAVRRTVAGYCLLITIATTPQIPGQ